MPYIIKKVKEDGKTGYKVCKKNEPSRCFSEHALTEEKAKKQRTAIILSEMGLSRRKGGGLSEEMPKTINDIKEALNSNGFDDHVFDLDNKKPKPNKADWKKLYEKCLAGEMKQASDPKGKFVSGPEEGFAQLSLMSKKHSKS